MSFARDVLAQMVSWQCTNGACHGGAAPANLPRVDASDRYATYAALLSFTLSDGKPYVVHTSPLPNDSGISCNLRGTCGTRMPVGVDATDAEIAVVEAWIGCGSPNN